MPTTSRAAVHASSVGLTVVDVEVADPGPGQVLVRMGASGVCGSDRHVLDGEWTMPSPTVMGHEGAGTVTAVGPGVTATQPGERVILSWFCPCQACRACAEGRSWVCTGSRSEECLLPDGTTPLSFDGEPAFPYLAVGSMSRWALVPEQAAVAVPDEVPFDVAALLGCSVATGFGAVVNDAAVSPGRSAVVIGAGGVGLSIIMALHLAGAGPIIAVDVTETSLEMARSFGATHTLHATDHLTDRVTDITGYGADVAFEAIGRPESIAQMPGLLTRGGTAVVVGLPPEDQPITLDALSLAEEGKRLIGSNYGSTVPRRDFPRLAALYLNGRLPVDRLITRRVSLEEIDSAVEDMRAGARGRTVVIH